MNPRSIRPDGGLATLEVLLLLLIAGLGTAAAIPYYTDGERESRRASLVRGGRGLYQAFMAYRNEFGTFPAETGPLGMNPATLHPLATQGYFPGAAALVEQLEQERLMLYLAPDIDGPNAEFIAVLRSSGDLGMTLVVAHTGIITGARVFLDGVYKIEQGKLEEVEIEHDR